jgi:hypothetical protein
MYGAFLIDPTFWSRIGFLISYIATFFIALEVLRLVYTDVNKRDVEKFLEAYSKQRAASPPSRGRRYEEKYPSPKKISVNIDELEMGRPVTQLHRHLSQRKRPSAGRELHRLLHTRSAQRRLRLSANCASAVIRLHRREVANRSVFRGAIARRRRRPMRRRGMAARGRGVERIGS